MCFAPTASRDWLWLYASPRLPLRGGAFVDVIALPSWACPTDDGMLPLAEFGQGKGCDLSQLGGGKHGAAKGADRAGEPSMTFASLAAQIGMLSSKLAPRSGLQVADGGAAIAADIATGDDRNLLGGKSFVIVDGINLYDGKEQRHTNGSRLSLEPPFTAAKRQALALPIIQRVLDYAEHAESPK